MKVKSLLTYGLFLLTSLYSVAEETMIPVCLEDFNISSYWHDGMTWKEFLNVRHELRRPGLIKYLDKIELQSIAKTVGLDVPKTYVASNEKDPFIEVISALSTYVVKPTHLSCSDGLIIVKDGINMLTGKPISPEQVQESMFKVFGRKPRESECWALHHVKPGFMIQEYIPNREEVKIQTIWGKAIIGEWRGGESKNSTTRIWGRYDRDGKRIRGKKKAPEWWSEAVAAAELMAERTDALRVDFLVKDGGVLLLNELGFRVGSDWSTMKKEIEDSLNDGYRLICKGRGGNIEGER